jgi:putative two-component system response regulator
MNAVWRRMPDARIFIVDDMPENIDLLETLLSDAGYRDITSTTDPRKANDLIRNENFDLLVLDLKMPYMNGFQVMEQLAKDLRDDYLPVLVLTGEMDREYRIRALQSGARDFVTKPFDGVEVLNRINNILEVRALYKAQKQQAEELDIQVRERTRELRQRNDELKMARLEIIRRLGRAAEYRDNETGMHLIRMSKSCQSLALAAGLNETFAENLLRASPMHDIGKIGIPDGILLKPGRLNPEEWEVMKTHAAIGGDIIGDFDTDLMRMARTIALSHHEKWDGSGYPHALQGDAIPIEGLVAAICDVFDALTSDRPYKKAWPVDDAISYISGQAGSHFDPALVGRFMDILPKIFAIREKYADKD